MYFKNFDQVFYDFDVNGKRELKVVTDITHNARFRAEILKNVTVYDEYDIMDGETPEIIAEKIYGNPQYHWIIMLANDKYDYVNDFPLSTNLLEAHIDTVYGVNKYAAHHYVDYNGYIVDSSQPGAVPVSNYQYEEQLNESKRRIKIISPEIINLILKNFEELKL